MAFTALSVDAPIKVKKRWDFHMKKRLKIKRQLDKLLPKFDVTVAGTTTIDIGKKGIDKAYGMKKIMQELKCGKKDLIFT